MKCTERRALAGALIFFLILATIYNATAAPFESPDEVSHFYYVVQLLESGELPVMPPPAGDAPHYGQEGTQAPLYYGSAALFIRALTAPLGLDLGNAPAALLHNPHSSCRADLTARYNRAYLPHDPHQERFPYTGRVRVLHLACFWSSLLATATLAGIFAATRELFPQTPAAAWLALGLTSLTPEFLYIAGAVNNDNLVAALTTWGGYFIFRVLHHGPTWRRTLWLGLLSGLAILSKLSGIILLPLALAALLWAEPWPSNWRGWQHRVWQRLPQLLTLAGICAALTGWWFFRNWQLYGDLTAMQPHLATLPTRPHGSWGLILSDLPHLFRSWWGAFGCAMPPGPLYLFYLGMTSSSLWGLSRARLGRELSTATWGMVTAWLALMAAAYLQWNWQSSAAKGRLLYPALVIIAALGGRGGAYWHTQHRQLSWLGGGLLALSALALPFTTLRPLYAPPPLYADSQAIQPQHPLTGQFGEAIALLGYDLNSHTFQPGDELDVTLYWQALARPAENYTLAIQLVSALPADDSTLLNFNGWTGGGNYPTGLWHPGDVLADRYRLQLPAEIARAQGWQLAVVLFERTSGERLPFIVAGDPRAAATLAQVGVSASNARAGVPPTGQQLETPIIFGEALKLEGHALATTETALQLTLWWRSKSPLAQNLTTFVHLYDAEGEMLATADRPPLHGGFPTSLWQPGDRVQDEYTIALPAEAARPLRLGLGWYNPANGARPTAIRAEENLPAAEYLITVPEEVP
ncbi:MAG: glycosyltransferase family 39 protein [Chloroflexota bacterium]|nr:glycosyltransferase family 39 protein [Chloroflexota bacterium]